jgi:hypothetical protein
MSLAYVQTGATIDPDYATLKNTYLKPLTMWYALYKAIEPLEFKIMNTSIVAKKDAANSNQITDAQLANIKRIVIMEAEKATDLTVRYIVTQNGNFGKFPEYSSFQSYPDTILPWRTPGWGQHGIYFEKPRFSGRIYRPNQIYGVGFTNEGWNMNQGHGQIGENWDGQY